MKKLYFSVGHILGKICMFSFYILLPKFIGVQEYGKFSYTLAFCFIFAQPIIEFGLDIILVKLVSRGMINITYKVFLIRIFGTILAIILIFFVSIFFQIDFALALLLTLYLSFVAFGNVFFSFFRGKEIFIFEAILFPFGKLLVLFMLFFLYIFLHLKSAFLGGWSLCLSALFVWMAIMFIFKKKYYLQTDPVSFSYRELLREGFILFLTAIFWLIYFRVDTLMLGIMANVKEVGFYNISYRLIEGSFLIPSVIMAFVYPKLAREKENFRFIFLKAFFILFIFAFLCAIVIYFVSSFVILVLYGTDFGKSVQLLRLLCIVVFPIFIGHLTTQSLIALDKSQLCFFLTLLATLLNIILNLLFIPRWYSFGAAFSTIITEIFIVIFSGSWLCLKILKPGQKR